MQACAYIGLQYQHDDNTRQSVLNSDSTDCFVTCS